MEASTTETAQEVIQSKGAGVHATAAAKVSMSATMKKWSAVIARAKAKAVSAMKAKASVGAGTKAAAASSEGAASSGTSASAGSSSPGSSSSTAAGHAKASGSLKALMGLKGWTGARLGGAAKTGPVAAKASLVVKGLVAAGVGLAGLAVAAHTGDVSGAQAAVTAVPTWTSGQSILAHVQAGLGGGGSGGAGIQLGF